MRFRRRDAVPVPEPPLSLEEETAYRLTIDSCSEFHAYAYVNKAAAYPTKDTVVALSLSRKPSFASTKSRLSRKYSFGSFRYASSSKYATSACSDPSLVQSVSVAATSIEPTSPGGSSQLEPATKLLPATSDSSLSESIKLGLYGINSKNSQATMRYPAIYGVREPRSHSPSQLTRRPTSMGHRPTYKRTAGEASIIQSTCLRCTSLRASRLSLAEKLYIEWGAREYEVGNTPHLSPRSYRNTMAGRSTLFDDKSLASLTPSDSISALLPKIEPRALPAVGPDLFDFELPGFDPRSNRVLVK